MIFFNQVMLLLVSNHSLVNKIIAAIFYVNLKQLYSEFVLNGSHFSQDDPINNYSTRLTIICNVNRTEWSPIRSVIIRVITKSRV